MVAAWRPAAARCVLIGSLAYRSWFQLRPSSVERKTVVSVAAYQPWLVVVKAAGCPSIAPTSRQV
jgi:hypothetical protein